MSGDFDVVVVGASIAGCTAARLFAQRGARVALVERRPDMDAYKTVCTHYIQSSATPTIERLGLAPLIEERGAVRNAIDIWTPYGGWIRHRGDAPHGYNVTRRTLDPLLRGLTAETPGVELPAGLDRDRPARQRPPAGVVVEDRSRARRELRARAGRRRRRARLAASRGWPACPAACGPHNRFFYWAYWRGVRPAGDRSRMWFMEPDCAYTFPNEDGLSVVLVAPHRDRLPEFRADLEGAYMRFIDGAARRARPRRRDARVEAARQARPAERQPPRRAARARVRRRRRARRATRCGASAAAGRSRAPSGWSRRRPTRSSAAATSTRALERLPPRRTAGGSGRTTS